MSAFNLTPEADEDLLGIWRYTAETWGIEQADRYLALLESCCDSLSVGSDHIVPDYSGILRSRLCQHHVIFYLHEADTPFVIAVFHQRMNIMTRLKSRL